MAFGADIHSGLEDGGRAAVPAEPPSSPATVSAASRITVAAQGVGVPQRGQASAASETAPEHVWQRLTGALSPRIACYTSGSPRAPPRATGIEADVAEPTPDTTRRALLKSADVCELAKVQPYVLRSWEKEFPDLGFAKSAGGPRFYRQADVDRVLRIKQLVFGEGLTLSGARRKLEEERVAQADDELPFEEVVVTQAPAISADARARIAGVRDGLRSLLELLAAAHRGTNGYRRTGESAAAPLLPMDDTVPAAPAERKTSGRRKRSVAAAE